MKKIKKFFKRNPGVILILLIFVLFLILVPPFFNFPLNDDWAYGKSVKIFSETKEVKLSEWTAASFIAQLFWGYMFTLPFGFSFTALRVSTLIIALAGVIAFYFILKELKFSEKICIIGSLILLFNPLFFNLSYTFMTDIPFISVVLFSVLFYIKFIKTDDANFLIIGSIFSVISVLIRQNAILVPISLILFLIIKRKTIKFRFTEILIHSLPFIALVLFEYWYRYVHGIGIKYQQIATGIIYVINPIKIIGFLLICLFCISFYLAPLIILFLFNLKKIFLGKKQIYMFIISAFIYTCFLALYLFLIKDFPFLGYQGFIVNKYGIGTTTLAGIPEPAFPFSVWLVLSMIVIVNLSFITTLILQKFPVKSGGIRKIFSKMKIDTYLFFWILIILFLMFILAKLSVFDRYLITVFPFFLIILFEKIRNFRYSNQVLGLLAIVMFIFSITAMHDYIGWNKARWNGANYLFNQNISPKEIDGGFEFNGWYLYEYALANLSKYEKNESIESKGVFDLLMIKRFNDKSSHPTNPDAISWWFVADDKYIISFSEIAGYNTIKKIEYCSWMHFRKQNIYVLERAS